MPQEVTVKRTLLNTPTMVDSNRRTYMIEYRAGELPPHFIYIEEKDYTKEKEAALIKADIKKRIEMPPPEVLTL